ncbi:MAG TPA: helix-turn-helix domain-containing protein [Solirubrobacterales bacterium]|nr:helix-turn-helix domain-containing protein [Solirubrobacterales bacterium]
MDVFTVAVLGQRLRERQGEIEETIFARLPATDADGEELARGRREAIRSCLELVMLVFEQDGSWDDLPLVPPAAVVQARRVARSGRALSTVLQKYIGGYSILWDFVLEEIEQASLSQSERAELLRVASVRLTSVAQQVLPVVATTHTGERGKRPQSREERVSTIVRAVLQGLRVNTDELGYDVDGNHIGVVVTGADAMEAVETLAGKLNRRLLRVPQDDGVVWAWLGGRGAINQTDLPELGEVSPGLRISFGEPASGQKGFRETHCQAEEAMQVALHQRQLITRFADVLLLVPAVEDEQRGNSLISIYLAPLERSSEKNPTLKETLLAYFEAELNTTATAARLKVDRRTAMTRLRTVEARLGFPIYKRHAELEVALRLDQLRRSTRSQGE